MKVVREKNKRKWSLDHLRKALANSELPFSNGEHLEDVHLEAANQPFHGGPRLHGGIG